MSKKTYLVLVISIPIILVLSFIFAYTYVTNINTILLTLMYGFATLFVLASWIWVIQDKAKNAYEIRTARNKIKQFQEGGHISEEEWEQIEKYEKKHLPYKRFRSVKEIVNGLLLLECGSIFMQFVYLGLPMLSYSLAKKALLYYDKLS